MLISMNIMIGAGIYISPPDMAFVAGPLSYWGWFAALLVFLPVVLSFSKLAAYYPGEGGVYGYTKSSLGSFAGFLAGWIYFLGFVGAQSLQTLVLRQILTKELGLTLFIDHPWIFNACFLSLMLFLCTFSMKKIATYQGFVTILKLSPLFFVISILFFLPGKGGSELIESVDRAAGMPDPKNLKESLSLIWQTIPYAIFGYWGFEACSNISHRISGSKKNPSRVILLSFFLVGLIYSLFHFELIHVMGSYGLYHNKVENFISYAGWNSVTALKIGSIIFITCLSISYFNAILSELLSYSFTVHTLAKDKAILLADKIKTMNKNSQPIYATFINCFLTFLVSTFIVDKAELVAITNIGLVLTFLICLTALIKLSWSKKDYLYCLIPILGFASCFVVGYFSIKLVGEVQNIIPLFLLILLGIIVHLIARKKQKNL